MIRATFLGLAAILVAACAGFSQSGPSTVPNFSSPTLTSCDLSGGIGAGKDAPSSLSEACQTTDLMDVDGLAKLLATKTTLVVFDIDDTVLTPSSAPQRVHFFGSDRWYRWQTSLANDDKEKIRCLYSDVLPLDYEAARLHVTQANAAKIFNGIPNDKLFLTSRSPNYRGGTERELQNAGIKLPSLLPGHVPEFVQLDGHSMTYANGIYMTGGANKGDALVALLGSEHRYRAVVFADDGGKNIESMKKALSLAKTRIDYYGLQYNRVKKDPYPLALPGPSPDEVAESRATMKAWLSFIRDTYPERYEELKRTCGDFPIAPPGSR